MATLITRHDFPEEFIFGCATSSYQVEGGFDTEGKSKSTWDVFTTRRPDLIEGGSNGSVAIDHYHMYKEDVLQMKKLGLQAYRFSISWSRILPGGRLCSGVNRLGVQFYNDLIDFCHLHKIEPYVTLFHFDYPQCLMDEYDGFQSSKIVQDFAEFAEVCFWEFGDRVTHWITVNEGWTFSVNSSIMVEPTMHTQRATTTDQVLMHRSVRFSEVAEAAGYDPYRVAHNLLLCHAKAVNIYRTRYQAVQKGEIGITNMSTWYEPYDENKEADVAAAARAVDFMWGWFTAPVVHGDYPPVMREFVGKRLPRFTPDEAKMLRGSYDFIGLNYYTTNYAKYKPNLLGHHRPSFETDQQVEFLTERNDVPIGPNPGSPWLFVVPRGIHSLLKHNKDEYNNPLIYITENGLSTRNPTNDVKRMTVTQALKDEARCDYHRDHLIYVKKAIHDCVNVKAYFIWSMFDNFEWNEGFEARFGIIYVDYMNRLIRYPKDSAIWWMNFLNKNLPDNLKRQIQEISENEPVKRLKTGLV